MSCFLMHWASQVGMSGDWRQFTYFTKHFLLKENKQISLLVVRLKSSCEDIWWQVGSNNPGNLGRSRGGGIFLE